MPKLRSAVYYLQHPSHWAHFSRRALKYFQSDLDSENDRAEAHLWARNRAQPLNDLLAHLGLTSAPQDELPRMDARILQEAGQRAAQSKIKMGGGGHIELIYAIARLTGARSVVETGVAYGWSSLAFLAAMEWNGGGSLVSVDRPYPGAGNEPYVGIAVPDRLRRNWTLIREPDRNGLKRAVAQFPDGVDIAHYDSDKSYRGREFAYPIIWNALRPGGLFLSDDIQDNLAFAHFVRDRDVSYGVVAGEGKYVGIAIKPGAWKS
ncbi:MAG TPA: class I SAM-dependent methyltransferase [Rhizomicrobium sp.]|nr:class I SAM-dependent methyltransferase [Rhizomicrobium sp.]